MRAKLVERVAQRSQMPRRVVHAETVAPEDVIEVGHRAMKLREHAAGLARLLRRLERVARDAFDSREHAPQRAVVLEPELAEAAWEERRGEHALGREVASDGRDVEVHFRREDRVQPLQHELRAGARTHVPGRIDQARDRALERRACELERVEHGGVGYRVDRVGCHRVAS